mgnify:CR=1 FL=1
MQVKAEEAELERHGHDEPRMLFGKDIPIDLAHYYCHCEADKDAYDERAHAQQRVLAAIDANDSENDQRAKNKLEMSPNVPSALARTSCEVDRSHAHEGDADHHNGDASHGGCDDLAQERHDTAARHDHKPADETHAEES